MAENNSRIITQRKKKLGILGLIVGGLMLAQPLLWQWVEVLAAGADNQGVGLEQVDMVKKKVVSIQQSYDKQKLLLEQMVTVVPREARTLQIIQRLEAKAREAGVTLQVEKITDNEVGASEEAATENSGAMDTGIVPLKMDLSSEGSPANLLKYIALIENLRELSQIDEVRLSAIRGPLPSNDRFSMDVEITFYLSR